MNLRIASWALRGASRVVLVAVLGGLLVTTVRPETAAASTSAVPSRFVAVGPARLADTRNPAAGGFTRLDGSTIRVQVTGRHGIPADATAAALTVTATDARSAGFVTVYPAGSARQLTANVTFNGPGEIVANGALVALGAGGAVDIYVTGGPGIVVDVSGAFLPAPGGATAGRFQPISGGARRVLDTREQGGVLGPAGTRRVARPDFVPADAMAVVVNIAIDQSGGAGFVTAWPAGAAKPATSVLNTERSMQTRSAMSIIPVTSAGFDVYSMSGGHIIVDVAGYFTGGSAGSSSDGLFVAVDPNRILDTRGPSPLGNGVQLQAGWTVEVPVTVSGSALVYNLTTVDALRPGYTTAYPAGNERSATANVNAIGPGTAIANLAVTALSTRGVALFSMGGEHLVADMTGYFTGRPLGAPKPAPVNVDPRPAAPAGCETESLARLNALRAAHGVGALVDDPAALDFACTWSAQMTTTNFKHSTQSQRAGAVGCPSGENIAYASVPTDLFDMWVASPGHFENMVSPSYTRAAIGYVTKGGIRYGTMVLVIGC